MKYFAKRLNNSKVYGYNASIKVYRIVKNRFELVGEEPFNTSAHVGDHTAAAQILSEKYGYKIDKTCYKLARKDIEIIWLP